MTPGIFHLLRGRANDPLIRFWLLRGGILPPVICRASHRTYADSGMRDSSGSNAGLGRGAVFRLGTKKIRYAWEERGKEERNSYPFVSLLVGAADHPL